MSDEDQPRHSLPVSLVSCCRAASLRNATRMYRCPGGSSLSIASCRGGLRATRSRATDPPPSGYLFSSRFPRLPRRCSRDCPRGLLDVSKMQYRCCCCWTWLGNPTPLLPLLALHVSSVSDSARPFANPALWRLSVASHCASTSGAPAYHRLEEVGATAPGRVSPLSISRHSASINLYLRLSVSDAEL